MFDSIGNQSIFRKSFDAGLVKVDQFYVRFVEGVVIPRIYHKPFASDHGVGLKPRSNLWVGNDRCNFVANPLCNSLVRRSIHHCIVEAA